MPASVGTNSTPFDETFRPRLSKAHGGQKARCSPRALLGRIQTMWRFRANVRRRAERRIHDQLLCSAFQAQAVELRLDRVGRDRSSL